MLELAHLVPQQVQRPSVAEMALEVPHKHKEEALEAIRLNHLEEAHLDLNNKQGKVLAQHLEGQEASLVEDSDNLSQEVADLVLLVHKVVLEGPLRSQDSAVALQRDLQLLLLQQEVVVLWVV